MTAWTLLAHGDDGAHMGGGSIWVLLSMVAFAVFLLAFAWSLIRPTRQRHPSPTNNAVERYALGQIDADDFERIIGDIESRRG